MAKPAVLRTPDARFSAVPDFPHAPSYVDRLPGLEGLRVHYVDEGPRDAPVFLCLHGEPTWSFLYRKMARVFLASGGRVVAPDFLGFGRSDKPTDPEVYTFDFHRRMLVGLVEHLDLGEITLVCQDWGGILGLTLPPQMPERFSRLLCMNTALCTGDVAPSKGFLEWKAYVASTPDLDVGALMGRAVPALDESERAAYNAPFPDKSYKVGVQRFPAIVPISRDMEGAAISTEAAWWWKNRWDGRSFMAVGPHDPVLGLPVMRQLREVINGCPEPLVVRDAGHFVQERGDLVARAALDAWEG
jgi:haloalkane dehalogenase